jgi:hypothetical protein
MYYKEKNGILKLESRQMLECRCMKMYPANCNIGGILVYKVRLEYNVSNTEKQSKSDSSKL